MMPTLQSASSVQSLASPNVWHQNGYFRVMVTTHRAAGLAIYGWNGLFGFERYTCTCWLAQKTSRWKPGMLVVGLPPPADLKLSELSSWQPMITIFVVSTDQMIFVLIRYPRSCYTFTKGFSKGFTGVICFTNTTVFMIAVSLCMRAYKLQTSFCTSNKAHLQ